MLCRTLFEIAKIFGTHLFRLVMMAATVAMLSTSAHADIIGFGDFSNFTFNKSDGSSAPTVAPDTIHLTNAASGEVRSVFDNTRQSISQFTATFGFRAVGVPNNTSEFGACFVIQNNSLNSVATNNSGIWSEFGYSDWQGVFNRSTAISLEYGSLSANSSASALYTNGGVGGGAATTNPVNIFSGDLINVTLTYNGSILHENLVDTTTSATYDAFYLTNIASTIGSSTAYVGFTANTRNTSGAMDFSNFKFTSSVPEPSTFILLGIGAISLLAYVWRRT